MCFGGACGSCKNIESQIFPSLDLGVEEELVATQFGKGRGVGEARRSKEEK